MTSRQYIQRSFVSTSLLRQLIDQPDLPARVTSLSPESFSALVRQIGLEDAAEIVALATTEQLTAAFDEDLFTNDRPGERETFDAERFSTWVEVLVQAGDAAAADIFAAMSEDFVVSSLSHLVIALHNDTLNERLGEGDDDARRADKALESALTEELDGYLLVAKRHNGFDAVLSLILALDRTHRAFLERILDRMADLSERYIENLDTLWTVLSDSESLAEDVEGDREDRRIRSGYVSPRDARSFLRLSLRPVTDVFSEPTDPVTKAFFREFRTAASVRTIPPDSRIPLSDFSMVPLLPGKSPVESSHEDRLLTALQWLFENSAEVFYERLQELAYLSNALSAGASFEGRRFSAIEASRVALTLVARGAFSAAESSGRSLQSVIENVSVDILFRAAVSAFPEQIPFQIY